MPTLSTDNFRPSANSGKQSSQKEVIPFIPHNEDFLEYDVGYEFYGSQTLSKNVIFYKSKNEVWNCKPRLPLKHFTTNAVASANTTGRGIYFWRGSYYSVYGDTLYKDTSSLKTLVTTSKKTQVGWCEGSDSSGTYLIMCDGTHLYRIRADGTVTCVGSGAAAGVDTVDADFPNPHIPSPVFLDGYVFLIKASAAEVGTADIYNCVLDTPTSWVATDFISVETTSNNLVGLALQNNHVVAFGTKGTEFFYNAANASGSPLGRNKSAYSNIALAYRSLISMYENDLYFIGVSEAGDYNLWKFNNLTATRIKNRSLEMALSRNITSLQGSYSSIFWFTMYGKPLLAININGTDEKSYNTYVYDINDDLCYMWSRVLDISDYASLDGSLGLIAGTSGGSYAAYKNVFQSFKEGMQFQFLNENTPSSYSVADLLTEASDTIVTESGDTIIAEAATGDAYYNNSLSAVANAPIDVDIWTKWEDFGTKNRKRINRVSYLGRFEEANSFSDIYINIYKDDVIRISGVDSPVLAVTISGFKQHQNIFIPRVGACRKLMLRLKYKVNPVIDDYHQTFGYQPMNGFEIDFDYFIK